MGWCEHTVEWGEGRSNPAIVLAVEEGVFLASEFDDFGVNLVECILPAQPFGLFDAFYLHFAVVFSFDAVEAF